MKALMHKNGIATVEFTKRELTKFPSKSMTQCADEESKKSTEHEDRTFAG